MTTAQLLFFLLFASAPSFAADLGCVAAPRSFGDVSARILGSADALAGHIRGTHCLVASCDPGAGRRGECYTSEYPQVLSAQSDFASKAQKVQAYRNALKNLFDRFNASMKSLGGEEIQEGEGGFACKGAAHTGVSAMEARKKPLQALSDGLRQMKFRENLREELNHMNRHYASSVEQMTARNFQLGPFTKWLPCQPQLVQEFAKTRQQLTLLHEEATNLDTYISAQACRISKAQANFAELEKKCGDGAVVKNEPVPHDVPVPKEKSVPPAEVAKPKDPESWGKLSKKEWKANDEYKASIAAATPRALASNQTVSDFLAQAKASGQSDYALRIQAAINATSMDVNGESVGPAPSVFQDGQMGSRTRGAIDYYLKSPAYRDAFLKNLQAYGVSGGS